MVFIVVIVAMGNSFIVMGMCVREGTSLGFISFLVVFWVYVFGRLLGATKIKIQFAISLTRPWWI